MYFNKPFIVFIGCISIVGAPVPGTFFWKPRIGLDLTIPTTESNMIVSKPTKENIKKGLVVFINGYQVGMTVIALAAGITSGYTTYPHLNMLSAHYHTNVYRWSLRHLSLLPYWISGHGGHYCDTHKVWKRRFYYMDEFMPSWLKKTLFYVDKKDWDKEEQEFKNFKKYSEPAFGKHYRYPTKSFNEFYSELTFESDDDSGISSAQAG